MSRRWWNAVIVLGCVALALKCLLAWNTVGTNDILTWEKFRDVAVSLGPAHLYSGPIVVHDTTPPIATIFNHPPLVAVSLPWLSALAEATGVTFRALLRILASLADAGTLLIVCLAVRRGVVKASPLALCALAVCPTSIMIAGFHGNTDAIMVFFLVLSIYALECWRSPLLCGLFLGLAMEIKVVPVLLLPALILYLATWRDRFACLTAILLAAVVPALPFADSVGPMLKNLFGYQSLSGHWGSTWLWAALHLPKMQWFVALEKALMFATLAAASVWMNVRLPRVPLFTQWGVLLFLFMFLTPGFGIQYLIWLVPWVVMVGGRAMLAHYALSGLFVFIVYTYWSGGLPWYFANSYTRGWHGWMHLFQFLAWSSTLLVLYGFWRTFAPVGGLRPREMSARRP